MRAKQRLRLSVYFAITVCFLFLSSSIGAAGVQVGFSPGGTAEKTVLATIQVATSRIDLAGYYFTSKPIAQALLAASKKGVAVRIMVDEKANTGKYSAAQFLANQGMTVRINGKYATMHNKFIITDNKTVETGSFNYTAAANDKNAENVIVIDDIPSVATMYEQEFERLWSESTPLNASY